MFYIYKTKEYIKKIIPHKVYLKYSNNRFQRNLLKLHKEILTFYNHISPENLSTEQKEVIEYLKTNSLCTFPYGYSKVYKSENVAVFKDDRNGLLYVMHENKRLYFKRNWDENKIKRMYTALLIEQDIHSPHRYLTDTFFVEDGDVVADVGAGDGNFALSVVEKADRIYIFEGNKEWIEPINCTFSPWRNKVSIINKYVSDKDDNMFTCLDSFFGEKNDIDFIKIDVEGSEKEVLNGCARILSDKKKLKLIIAAYYKKDDAREFSNLLISEDFLIEFSRGYMLFMEEFIPPYRNTIKPPYLRKGLIRAARKEISS